MLRWILLDRTLLLNLLISGCSGELKAKASIPTIKGKIKVENLKGKVKPTC